MILKINKKTNKSYWSLILISLLIMASLVFSGSNEIIKFVIVVGFNIIYIFLGEVGNQKHFGITGYIGWYVAFHTILFLYGVGTTYGGYSAEYHLCIFMSGLLIYYHMWRHLENIEEYIEGFSIISSVLIIGYLLIYERSVLISKWSLLLQGSSWYRIGDGIGINPNSIAVYLGVLSFPIIHKIFKPIGIKNKIALVPLVIVQTIVIFFTGSKKGFVLIVLVVLLLPIVTYDKKINIKGIVIGVFLTVLVLYLIVNVPILYYIIGHRIGDMLESFNIDMFIQSSALQGTSTGLRLGMIQKALNMFWKHPLFGGGWNVFAVKGGYGMYSHNNFTELLVSMGVFGFTLFYSYYFVLLLKLLMQSKTPGIKYNLVLLGALIFVDGTAINVYGSIVDFLVLEMIFCQYVYEKNKQAVKMRNT